MDGLYRFRWYEGYTVLRNVWQIFGESNDNIISDILHSNKILIPIETNVDIMLTLIAIQRKNTFGETLINQILSHILLNFKNGVEIFATHFFILLS